MCVRAATFTLTVFSCSTELGIKHDNVLLNEDVSWDREQSESLLKLLCRRVCCSGCQGCCVACVEGKSDIRHVPVGLAVYCNLHKDELDSVLQAEVVLQVSN